MGCCLREKCATKFLFVGLFLMTNAFSHLQIIPRKDIGPVPRFYVRVYVFVYLLTGYQRQVSVGTGLKTSISPSSFIASHQSHHSSSDYWPVTRFSRKLTVLFPVSWPPLTEMAPSTLVRIRFYGRKLSFFCWKITRFAGVLIYSVALKSTAKTAQTRWSGHMTKTVESWPK